MTPDPRSPTPHPSSIYVDVVVTVPARGIDRSFTYRVPPDLTARVCVGGIVKVPFHGRTLNGYVVAVLDAVPPDLGGIRDVVDVLGPETLLPTDLQEVARWMQGHYGCVLVEAFQTMVPEPVRAALGRTRRGATNTRVRVVTLVDPVDEEVVRRVLETLDGEAAQARRVLDVLRERRHVVPTELLAVANAGREVLARLRQEGLLRYRMVCEPGGVKSPAHDPGILADPSGAGDASLISVGEGRPDLNQAQQRAVDETIGLLEAGRPHVVLLHGVTGSGKTEVYLRVLEAAIARGRQGLVLVPEISLTPQAVDRYRNRLGDKIAVLHSGLGPADRVEQWWRLKNGRAAVALGARSCVFAPLEAPGIFVVDEEHEPTYKQEQTPRYHARQVAIRRAIAARVPVLLGSATPSLESYYWATQGNYTRIDLPHRVENRPLPEVEIVDLRCKRGAPRAIGHVMRERMRDVLARGEQVMLLHNRRGFASYLMCTDCGGLLRCPRCDISLTFHAAPPRLMCHYCLFEKAPPSLCADCGGHAIRYFGSGTQRVEEELLELFPGVSMIRMDRDTTRLMGDHRRVLERFARGEAQVLVGTQMIAKGHDFPRVTLVGVVLADTALNLPDFRAAERTFSLLTQVAGRAGRGELPGRVVIQSYNPDHFAVRSASAQDYRGFYEQELTFRRELAYPPFMHLVNVILSSEDETSVASASHRMADALRPASAGRGCLLLGPAPCALARIHRKARWHLVFKCGKVQEIMPSIREYLVEKKQDGVSVAIDADPMSML